MLHVKDWGVLLTLFVRVVLIWVSLGITTIIMTLCVRWDHQPVMITFITFMSDSMGSLTTRFSEVFLWVHQRSNVFLWDHKIVCVREHDSYGYYLHKIFGEIWFVDLNLIWCYILLIWCDIVWSLEFDPVILSRLDAYAWFGGSRARDVLEVGAFEGRLKIGVGVLEENFYLQRSFNLRGWSTSKVRESSSSWEN